MASEYHERRSATMNAVANAQREHAVAQAHLAALEQTRAQLRAQAQYFNARNLEKPPEIAELLAANAQARRRTESRMDAAQQRLSEGVDALAQLASET